MGSLTSCPGPTMATITTVSDPWYHKPFHHYLLSFLVKKQLYPSPRYNEFFLPSHKWINNAALRFNDKQI
jgi:hypothetical protein